MNFLQTILIPKRFFKKYEAIDWVYQNGFYVKKIDERGNFYRFRQRLPDKSKSYTTIVLDDGVELVFQY